MKRIYLSGRTTGDAETVREAMAAAQAAVTEAGCEAVNPMDHDGSSEETPWERHIAANIRKLSRSDVLLRLPGWDSSLAGKIESEYADLSGIPVIDCKPEEFKERIRRHTELGTELWSTTLAGYTCKTLEREGINTVADLAWFSLAELAMIRELKSRELIEIRKLLDSYGVTPETDTTPYGIKPSKSVLSLKKILNTHKEKKP